MDERLTWGWLIPMGNLPVLTDRPSVGRLISCGGGFGSSSAFSCGRPSDDLYLDDGWPYDHVLPDWLDSTRLTRWSGKLQIVLELFVPLKVQLSPGCTFAMHEDPKTQEKGRRPVFPELPIITVDAPPRMSEGEKYGGLYYLGIAGLLVVVALVGWFGYSAWTLRDVWRNVYILHDESRSEADRIRAADALSRDHRVSSQQRWEIALRKPLPPLARYLVAESLTPDIVVPDPDLFGKIVAFSEDWPDWLRLMGVRLMTVAASEGVNFSRSTLDKLAAEKDSTLPILVDYIRAVSSDADARASSRLRDLGKQDLSVAPLARLLAASIEVGAAERSSRLDEVTRWLRHHDPAALKLWGGWDNHGGGFVPVRP